MVKKRQRTGAGFTLIEIMLVLAISSMLSLVLLGFYANTRRRAEFTDAVDRTVAFLERTKTEVSSSFTTGTGDNGSPNSSPNNIFFGKLVEFPTSNSANQSLVTVQPLTINKTLADTNAGEIGDIREQGSVSNFTIPWGVEAVPDNGNYKIVFARRPTDGILNTYVLTGDQDPFSTSSYTSIQDTNDALILLTSPGGLEATITINGLTGEITRVFDN